MANEEQLAILEQGVKEWNKWANQNGQIKIDLSEAELMDTDLIGANLGEANLRGAVLLGVNLGAADLSSANLSGALLYRSNVTEANLRNADLRNTDFTNAKLSRTDLRGADLRGATLTETLLFKAIMGSSLSASGMRSTTIGDTDLSSARELGAVFHDGPSDILINTFVRSKGKIPEVFLRGCGLSDWEIEAVKLYNPDLTHEEKNRILFRIQDLQASQSPQISRLFISYSHADSEFVEKLGEFLQDKGVRYWRDIHEMKAGRIETQINRGIRQNPTVLIILSEHSINSDWVQHEVRTARELEKELERDVLCPVALDDSWKSSRWPKRLMEQITEYNILDFSAWQDDSKFDSMFRKLIDGLDLFYKR